MHNTPARRIAELSEPQTIAMAKKGRELAKRGVDVINLSLGEPDFSTPDAIKNAAKVAIDENYSYYTPVPGYPDLRTAISEKLLRDNGLTYTPEQIVVSTGAKQAIVNAMMTLVNPGDEVIIPTPYWVSYSGITQLCEGNAVFIKTTVADNFKITAQMLERAITSKSRVLIFSTPCNPTGAVYSEAELAALAEVIVKYPQLYVICDEIYEYINFTGKHASLASFKAVYNQVITINGLSKGYAMTGWRIGYLAAPKWIAEAAEKYQSQITSATCSIAQRAAICAMSILPTEVAYMQQAFLERRNVVISALKGIPGLKVSEPEGAFYAFPDVSHYFGKQFQGQTIENAQDLSIYLLNQGHVSTVPGDAFGEENCIRLSFAAAIPKLQEAMTRISRALLELA